MDVRRRLGLNRKRLRDEQGLSQESFADLFGLHRTYISGIERGVRNPTVIILDRLAKALCHHTATYPMMLGLLARGDHVSDIAAYLNIDPAFVAAVAAGDLRIPDLDALDMSKYPPCRALGSSHAGSIGPSAPQAARFATRVFRKIFLTDARQSFRPISDFSAADWAASIFAGSAPSLTACVALDLIQ